LGFLIDRLPELIRGVPRGERKGRLAVVERAIEVALTMLVVFGKVGFVWWRNP
jgi:hypothetical protein